MHKIFVYGTLKKGFGNHFLLRNSNFLSTGETVDRMTMYERGIPFVSDEVETSTIKGEIYNVDNSTLKSLDSLEGHPNWYVRTPKKVISNGSEIDIEMYIYNSDNLKKLNIIENGTY